MTKVAKLVLVDPENKYLLMYRSDHPTFGIDPDLPGGTMEENETSLQTMIREVKEEAGVDIDATTVKEVYSGTEYSENNTHYSLFIANINERPEITISWEHSSYEWLDKETFMEKSKNANDTYMHMVYETVKNTIL